MKTAFFILSTLMLGGCQVSQERASLADDASLCVWAKSSILSDESVKNSRNEIERRKLNCRAAIAEFNLKHHLTKLEYEDNLEQPQSQHLNSDSNLHPNVSGKPCANDGDCGYDSSCILGSEGYGECVLQQNIQTPPAKQATATENNNSTSPPSPIGSSSFTQHQSPIFNSSSADLHNPAHQEEEDNEVEFIKRNGVYYVSAWINDVLKIDFVLDSGAAEVNISPDIVLTLIKTGTIKKNDFLPGATYKLADGSVVESGKFIIHKLRVGNQELENVEASISNSIEAPMLLGQNALEQLGSYTFDYDAGVVRFQNNAGTYENARSAYLKGDFTYAAKLLRPLAEQGNSDAQRGLGYMYYIGLGVTQDYREAIKWFRLSAEQGNSDAQFSLGTMYSEGQGVTQDYRESIKWYHLSAEQGNSIAQAILGYMYYIGLGVTQDYREAIKWFRLSAEQGNSDAQTVLGNMYYQGLGVTQDYIHAYAWYDLSANQGDKEAQKQLEMVAQQMTSAQIEEAQKIVRECITRNYKNCD